MEPRKRNTMFRICAGAIAFSSVLFVDAVSTVLEGVDLWKGVSEFGVAIVVTVLAFLGMGWWIKRRGKEQRDDYLALRTQVDQMARFQQQELLEIAREGARVIEESAVATQDNTSQLVKMTDALLALSSNLTSRPCAALEALPDDKRMQVVKILRGTHTRS